MVKVQDFSAANFEQSVRHVEERVGAYKEIAALHPETPEREIVKEALKFEPSPQAAPASAGTQANDDAPSGSSVTSLLPDYFEGGDQNGMREAVMRLAEVALHGDLKGALQDARKFSPYLEDAFHDALVDKVLPEMKKRGLI